VVLRINAGVHGLKLRPQRVRRREISRFTLAPVAGVPTLVMGGPFAGDWIAPRRIAKWAPYIMAQPELLGDVVIARKDAGTSYHIAVVVDDAAQGVTDVVRGQDLFEATHIHRLLQALLGLPVPLYHHHRLILDAGGERLAKRRNSETLADLQARGADPIALVAGLRRGALPPGYRFAG
jgi:glutamyl/glutaminyl-tRNA synthetase